MEIIFHWGFELIYNYLAAIFYNIRSSKSHLEIGDFFVFRNFLLLKTLKELFIWYFNRIKSGKK